METLLRSLSAVFALAFTASGALLVEDSFTYPDGPLITVSGGVWTNHSGVLGQVEVQSEQVTLNQAESEDVNRGLPGAPYNRSGWLYYSFMANFTALPAGEGTYFAHFKDSSTGYRAKVFATVTGAAAETYRLGIANGASSAPVTIPVDLALNTPCKVVVRYNTTNASSTLWLNPTSEASLVNRAEGGDNASSVAVIAFAFRQSSGMGVLKVDDLKIGTTFSDVATPGDSSQNAPLVSAIDDQAVAMNQAIPVIPFAVNDGETDPADLVVTANSSNPVLVPQTNVALGGAGADRTVTVTPAAGQQGQAVITLTVTDGDDNQTVRTFTITVGAPVISSVPNQVTPMNTPTVSIPFTVGDAETPASLTLSGWSSHPALVPPANIAFGGSGSNRNAVITPAAGMRGSATVGFVVNDGSSAASNQFTLTVAPVVAQDLNERFAYPDGPVQDVSTQLWSVFSPQNPSNDCQVVSERLLLSATHYDDVRYYVGFYDLEGNGCYATNGGYVIYYSLALNVTQLPASSTYFAFLKDNGAVNHRARAFVTTNGAAPACYRVGVAAASATPSACLTNDLAPNASYTLTVRYTVGNGDTRLWLNASGETSPGVDATDSAAVVEIWNFAFRQNTGLGTLYVDDVKVGSAWNQVYQAPNWPPILSDLPDVTTPFQTPTHAVPFTVGDQETAPASLELTASSDNPALVPVSKIVFGGSGAHRTVTVTPASGQSGQTRVSVRVCDAGGNSMTRSFLLTVLDANNPPAISTIPNQSTVIGVSTPAVPFSVSDLETPAASLTVSGCSDNAALVPAANIVFGGSGSERTVRVTPAEGQAGAANIFVVVSDGVLHTTNTFALTVNFNILLADDFSYPDGSVITNSSFLWAAHSGTTGQTCVVGGQLMLSGGLSEDVSAALTNAPFHPSNAPVLYAGFTATFSALPTNAYFAHFKDAGTGFRCRVFATSNNAAPGAFRLGVANAAGSLDAANPPLARDLRLHSPFRVVLRYDVAAAASALWVNALAESDQAAYATDTATASSIVGFAFRQTVNMGALAVDDLMVGTTFDAVRGGVPNGPPVIVLSRGDNGLRLEWPASATAEGYVLQWKPALDSGSWQPAGLLVDTVGATNSVIITPPAGSAFFRLAK